MKWYEILERNWAQIAVVLGTIGYILKVIFDYRYKKREITYSYFMKDKMAAVMTFLERYGAAVMYINQEFNIVSMRAKVIEGRFNDPHVLPKIESFVSSYGQLLLFFPEEEISEFTKVVNNVHEIVDRYTTAAGKVSGASFTLTDFTTPSNEKDKKLHENNGYIRSLCARLRMQYVK